MKEKKKRNRFVQPTYPVAKTLQYISKFYKHRKFLKNHIFMLLALINVLDTGSFCICSAYSF